MSHSKSFSRSKGKKPNTVLPLSPLKNSCIGIAKFRGMRVKKDFWIKFRAVIQQIAREKFKEICDFQKQCLPDRSTLMTRTIVSYFKYTSGRKLQEEDELS